jgi:hypothetical protein
MAKELKLPVKFNPGLKRYEPELTPVKSDRPIKFSWLKLALILLGIIAFSLLIYLILRNY